MARVVNVLLEITNPGTNELVVDYDINKMGLISMVFNRYSGNQKIVNGASILSELELVFFDKTGTNIIQILQNNKNTVRLKYGFDDNLSRVYELSILKINTTYNNMGCMVSVGAIAKHVQTKFPAEYYLTGWPIADILKRIAKRNNWYIGSGNYSSHIDISQAMQLPVDVFKGADESDINFIINKIKPLVELSATNIKDPLNLGIEYFDVQLTYKRDTSTDNELEFFFIKNTQRTTTRTLWRYNYGAATDSEIISMTNKIDQSFLLGGLKFKIPRTSVDRAQDLLIGSDGVSIKLKDIILDQLEEFNKKLALYNLPNLSSDALNWEIELIEAEDADDTKLPELIVKKFGEYISVLNTIDLEIIGNPFIQQGDLVQIDVMLDPTSSIPVQNPFFTGMWKVVTIGESISQAGYTTTLHLVREFLNIE